MVSYTGEGLDTTFLVFRRGEQSKQQPSPDISFGLSLSDVLLINFMKFFNSFLSGLLLTVAFVVRADGACRQLPSVSSPNISLGCLVSTNSGMKISMLEPSNGQGSML